MKKTSKTEKGKNRKITNIQIYFFLEKPYVKNDISKKNYFSTPFLKKTIKLKLSHEKLFHSVFNKKCKF